MNIFKKISLANKAIQAYKDICAILDSTHITNDLKEVIEALKSDFERLVKLFPSVKATYLEIKEALFKVKK